MMDAVDYALNKYMDKIDKQEKMLERFEAHIDSELQLIEASIRALRYKAKDWYGYDFSEELECMLEDLI